MDQGSRTSFELLETTIAKIHCAYREGRISSRELVLAYFDRIEKYDRAGPGLNSIISVNPRAIDEAAALDRVYQKSGFVGPLHGIPLVVKDQADVAGMPTTMGSLLFKDHNPGLDSFVIGKLRAAGAIIIAKSTLGELGAGDTHGSLFGSTKCVYDLERTAGGSSGGSGVAVSANLCAVAIGQEGNASIRRPAAWDGVVGMRPTAGLVSRGGVYSGWPSLKGSLGPMSRTVEDLARVLDCMIGYDPGDPLTAVGFERVQIPFANDLNSRALDGARIGILRDTIGYGSEPQSDDFAKVQEVFDRAVSDLQSAGAVLVDPVEIADLKPLLASRARSLEDENEAFRTYAAQSPNFPFKDRAEAMSSPAFAQVLRGAQERWKVKSTPEQHYAYLRARERLMIMYLKTMADHRLDAIVHKAVEHQPTYIRDGLSPPYRDMWGAPFINTFLTYIPAIVVPSGMTRDNLPAGITFLGRPFDDVKLINFAHSYERLTRRRVVPDIAP